jgi:hypothetical protein
MSYPNDTQKEIRVGIVAKQLAAIAALDRLNAIAAENAALGVTEKGMSEGHGYQRVRAAHESLRIKQKRAARRLDESTRASRRSFISTDTEAQIAALDAEIAKAEAGPSRADAVRAISLKARRQALRSS